jgi:hypothetical protein
MIVVQKQKSKSREKLKKKPKRKKNKIKKVVEINMVMVAGITIMMIVVVAIAAMTAKVATVMIVKRNCNIKQRTLLKIKKKIKEAKDKNVWDVKKKVSAKF